MFEPVLNEEARLFAPYSTPSTSSTSVDLLQYNTYLAQANNTNSVTSNLSIMSANAMSIPLPPPPPHINMPQLQSN